MPEYPPLPDVFFSLFPEVLIYFVFDFVILSIFQIPNAIRVSEYIMLILLISTFSVIGFHQHRLHVSYSYTRHVSYTNTRPNLVAKLFVLRRRGEEGRNYALLLKCFGQRIFRVG